jgi:hypothetical protein
LIQAPGAHRWAATRLAFFNWIIASQPMGATQRRIRPSPKQNRSEKS